MPNATMPLWLQIALVAIAIASPLLAWLGVRHQVRNALKVAEKQARTALEPSRQQVHGSVVSANRQKWIDALRDDIAEFLTESDGVRARLQDNPIVDQDIRERGRKLTLLFNRIRLRLNPHENDHSDLLELLEKLLRYDNIKLGLPLEDEAARLAQQILKREWRRVKSGD